MTITTPKAGPEGRLTPAEQRFADLLAQADRLRRDLERFADDPRSRRVLSALMDFSFRSSDGRSFYVTQALSAARAVAFALDSFRSHMQCDFGSGVWFDKTEARDDV